MNTILLDGLTAQILAGIMSSPVGRYTGVDTKPPTDLNDDAARTKLVAAALGYAKEILKQTASL